METLTKTRQTNRQIKAKTQKSPPPKNNQKKTIQTPKQKQKHPGKSMGILLVRSSSTESSGEELESPRKDLVRKKMERQVKKQRILKITAVLLFFLVAASILLASLIYDLVRNFASCQLYICFTALN